MPDDPHSLADLAKVADVTPRTIRYYVAQGLLPSPEAAGPNTRYGDGHLARLRLIKRLQREHLPLAEIRARLEIMTDEDVMDAVASMGTPSPSAMPDRSEALDFVRSLMRGAGVQPSVHELPAPYEGRNAAAVPPPSQAMHMLRRSESPAPPPPAAAPSPLLARQLPEPPMEQMGLSLNSKPSTRSQWERIPISPDVEIHVRRPLDRLSIKRVDRLERFARELFEEEP